jgi:CIC family chloride channel protein
MFTDAGMHGFTNALDLIPYSIEALLLAFMAFLFVKTFYGIKDLFGRWNLPNSLKPFFGGLITGTIALVLIEVTGDRKFVIDVLGGGYGILQEILHNDVTNLTLFILVLVAFGKILTTSFTISSGGSAGVFGPSMVIGGTIGAATGYVMQYIFPGLTLYPSTFAIVGMAGFFAAAANTPISTIIMVSELTGNYELLLPSMWVCSIAYLVAKKKWSIYKSQVPSKIYSQAHFGEFAPDIFETTTVEETYKKTRHFITIPSHWNMERILKMASDTSQRIFPVVDKDNVLQGTFTVSDVTHLLQAENGTSKTAEDIMHKSVLEVHPYETIRKAQQILQENQVEELLVIDDHENPPKILGIITASDIMTTYNKKLSRIKFGSDKPERLPEDKSVLNRISVNNVLETDLLTVEPDAGLGDLVKIIIRSKRNIFPVVDAKLKFYGIIMLNDIREVMFDTSKYETLKIKELMTKSPAIVNETDSMSRVMEKFEKTGAWNLPVIDRYHRFKGLVSKSTIFSVYRRQLLRQAEV